MSQVEQAIQAQETELISVLFKMLKDGVRNNHDSDITHLSFQGEGDTEILLHFKGKAFALSAERF